MSVMSNDEPERVEARTHAYRILEPLGQGGQGKTMVVEREGEPGSRYVLKQLRMEHVEDWKQVELFEREVSTLATLDHPGIPQLVDRVVEDERTAGIVQTWVPGTTVAQRITEPGSLSPERFEQVLRQTLEILAYLQERVPPVLHRDINPRNVMLDDERAYLIDFGAVRVGGKTDMTSVGTFGYMAPEQIIGRPEPASDVYGLGMTMVSLAERRDVGDLPIDAETGQVDPSRLLRNVEPRVRDVVLGMIEPGLGGRIGRAKEALRRLDEPPASEALVAQSAALATTDITAKRPMWAYVVAGVATAGVLGGVMVASSSGGAESKPQSVKAPPVRQVIPEPQPQPVEPEPEPEPVVAPPEPVAPSPPSRVVPTELTDESSAALTVATQPAGAEVYVDGAKTCVAPCTARVAFGKHTIVAQHEDERARRTVNVLEDTRLDISFED